MEAEADIGLSQVAGQIRERLQRYIEAQYHIRDEGIIEERRLLLEEPGAISQRPFVEVTPSYAAIDNFEGLAIPAVIRDMLSAFSKLKGVGVFPPYKHQADALEAFFKATHDGDDLVVATGTGSGKTETFLYTVMGTLALEASTRPTTWARHGVRALLLYPMNALVSDQTSRLRKMFGDENVAGYFHERWNRHARFGMYTSRTPYPGVRKPEKDGRHLGPLLEYYDDLQTSTDDNDKRLVHELKSRGRWPSKDLSAFLARTAAEKKTYQRGKRAGAEFTRHNWKQRLKTQPGDRELLTRHEMQAHAPDLLVTNYSMLEYMLLRPIERSIFAQTRDWLASDTRNQLLLVLDEAHMYRGVGGAEVALLIRRLQARLGIPRERLRCILTSASLGSGPAAEAAMHAFAGSLTGATGKKTFAMVTGTKEPRWGAAQGSDAERAALMAIDTDLLAAAEVNGAKVEQQLQRLASALSWSAPSPDAPTSLQLRQYVARHLTGFGPLEELIRRCSGSAADFQELADHLFPGGTMAERAAALRGLLGLGTFARRLEPRREDQPLTPARVHLMFRGLPSLYACISKTCPYRRHQPGMDGVVGRLHTAAITHCDCGARVFELYTHRDCGASFLRLFGNGSAPDFVWHERGGVLKEIGTPLDELHVYLENPHPDILESLAPFWIDVNTGRVARTTPDPRDGFRLCYAPRGAAEKDGVTTFAHCPGCKQPTRAGGGALKIMDLATKGEQPFANLVREQFVLQAATRPIDDLHPNGGRKALLFSDGRQKAARLARDLPREVERDSFREAITLAISRLQALKDEVRLDEALYAAFVSVCAEHHLHFFDQEDQMQLIEGCNTFRADYASDLEFALDDNWRPKVPARYRRALLRQVCDPYYSLVSACAAVVVPRQIKMKMITSRIGGGLAQDVISAIARGFVRELLADWAFDQELTLDQRKDEYPYFRPILADAGVKSYFSQTARRLGCEVASLNSARDALFEVLTRDGGAEHGKLLASDVLSVRLVLDEVWLQCSVCGLVQHEAHLSGCVRCGASALEPRPPMHPYMKARKDYFRDPLRRVLSGGRPVHITAEEHTAQLSQRDAGVVYATTEEYELRFQDVPLGPRKPPVDVLSCTTTMEVGIDIGSLTAVGLRTMPPQRENYQQRAGRAGRRGTSLSTVVTFAQGAPHDAFYFANPAAIISGAPRNPRIKSDNARLARRHVNAFLLQTFFHEQLDLLSEEELRALENSRPGVMSAFGTAYDFFTGSADFSLVHFERWIKSSVMRPRGGIVDVIAGWLPDEIIEGGDIAAGKREFTRRTAAELVEALQHLSRDPRYAVKAVTDEDDEADTGSLLDALFDHDVLPAYAFPTDLCSFVIQEHDQGGRVRVKERPQLSKSQALSEYAPGRLLVVDKRTYRVGGILVEGPPSPTPAAALFDKPLARYVGCDQCSYVRLEEVRLTPDRTPCPVCGTPMRARELLDPPAFSPEGGRPVREGDRDQEITYASSAQLPEFVDQNRFTWRTGVGTQIEYAHDTNVLLVVTNKGKDGAGFSVCDRCGAAWPTDEKPPERHRRPFLLPRYQSTTQCEGAITPGLYLGHQFKTDALLVRIRLEMPFDFSVRQRWLYDALTTLAEAISLGASLHLDIDPGELSAGYHLPEGDLGVAELYFFDTASGGAGYAADAGEELAAVLENTATLLAGCTCETSCTKCLRHYGNRYLHPRLDRTLALDLLRYALEGTAPAARPLAAQAAALRPLARYLLLEGWDVQESSASTTHWLLARQPNGGVYRRIGTHPALLEASAALASAAIPPEDTDDVVLVPDYVISRDLPAAYKMVLTGGSPPRPPEPAEGSVAHATFPVTGLQALEVGRAPSAETVSLCAAAPPGAVAMRPPSAALATAGIDASTWLVLTITDTPTADPTQVLLITRSSGTFRATGERWTVGRLKGTSGAQDVLVTYNRREAAFRPERVPSADVRVLGVVVAIVAEG